MNEGYKMKEVNKRCEICLCNQNGYCLRFLTIDDQEKLKQCYNLQFLYDQYDTKKIERK